MLDEPEAKFKIGDLVNITDGIRLGPKVRYPILAKITKTKLSFDKDYFYYFVKILEKFPDNENNQEELDVIEGRLRKASKASIVRARLRNIKYDLGI